VTEGQGLKASVLCAVGNRLWQSEAIPIRN
jgi:hypothetical protein